MTVNHSLHDPKQVSIALYGKITAALDELGYISNRASDMLFNATSRAINILLPPLTNRVFAGALRRIESVIDAHGYQTMLAHYGYKPEVEQERLEPTLPWGIDSLILTGRTHTPRTSKMIEVTGIPVVELMDSKSPCLDIAVGLDNFEAVRQMTAAIIARGHRHIAYLDARLDERTIIRQKEYEQAMLDAGLVSYSVMAERSSSYSSGIELTRQVWREYPRLDGVFCTNDGLAVGVAFECQCLELKVLDDMTIVGFHDHDTGQVMEPRLTSVLTPCERMSSIDAERLPARIRDGSMISRMLDLGFILPPGGSV